MQKIAFYLSICLCLLISVPSCKKDPVIIVPVKKMTDLVVPGGFRFGMTKIISVSVKLPKTVPYASTSMLVEIWDENAEKRPGRLIKTGTANHDGVFTAEVEIVSTAKKIFTHCFAGWRFISLIQSGPKSAAGVFETDYNTGYGSTLPQFCVTSNFSTTNAAKSGKNFPRPPYINVITNTEFNTAAFGKMDSWWMPMKTDSIWYVSDGMQNFVSAVAEEGHYFARVKNKDLVIGNISQLVNAQEGQIVSFSADVRGFDSQQDIRLFLLPRNSNNENFEIFSYDLVNPGIDWTSCTVSALMPKGTVTCQVLINSRATGNVDFDNALVVINNATDDTDGDGVPGWEDVYPDDPGRAYDDYFPGKGKPGTFAFEDAWPSQTDYDFNDLIVDYQIKRVCNTDNQVVEIDMISQVRAVGTTTKNGFGFQIYLSPDLISGVQSAFGPIDQSISIGANGTENGQKWATFILFQDASTTFPKIQEGSPTINTTLGYYFVVPTEYYFRIFLNEPTDLKSVSNDKINPFIFRNDDRSHEIHLPGYPPTDLANMSLFDTKDDASSSPDKWYQTSKGVPWALNVPVQFDYPLEKADLATGHLVFMDWVTNGGRKYADWYLDQTGYRNWDNIYRW